MNFDPVLFGKQIGGVIRDALAPILARLTALEAAAEKAATIDDRIGGWALEFERRAQDVMQRAVDALPKARDGVDGFGLDDFDAQLADDGRTVILRFTHGDRVIEKALPFPVVVDRGFWREGLDVAKGDGVTFGGSYWIAQADTATKPDTDNPDWRLAVKKGRDAKGGSLK